MPLLIHGLNHRTAELDLRGQLAFGPDELQTAVLDLCSVPNVTEAAILSTCNRTELHVNSTNGDDNSIKNWLTSNRSVSKSEVKHATYTWHELAAVGHAMRVASGLDSQILGEPQIQGQFKAAYQSAREAQTLGLELTLLEEFTLQTAKRIRTEQANSSEPVSVSFAALSMAKQIFADFSQTNVLLIGAGSNIRLIADYLRKEGSARFTVANRTIQHGEMLASKLQGQAIALNEVEGCIHEFDIVVSSTSSQEPLVSEEVLRRAVQKRRHKPMFIADLAVPRDIEASANAIPDVYLHTVDDLSKIISSDSRNHDDFFVHAEGLVTDGIACYEKKRRIQDSTDLLSRYREQVDEIKEGSLEKALKRLDSGDDASEVMKKLAHDLTNQIAHKPTLSIREASTLPNSELLHLLKRIYELDR